MPRYELIEGTSKKFWEITLEGTSFTTTYGRIGTDGQSSMKEYDSEEKARQEYDKLIVEKTKKGYSPVGASPTGGASAAKPAAAKVAPKPKAAVFDDEGDDEDEDEKPKPKPAAAAKPAAAKPAAAKPAAAKPAAAKSSKSATSGARYFEFVDGSSSKFWEITLEGTAFTTRYGKIGTEGQISMKEYDTDERTQREYDKLVAEKTKKGYVEK
jgi:predicted DNA-binding WGR domain protein